jgi:aryl-alcohol dehydrogenase-like predicted oxidoreductase
LIICFLSTNICVSSEYKENSNYKLKTEMEYVSISDRNKNSKKFSRLILGTDHLLQSEWTNEQQKSMNENEFNEFLDEAVKLGINTFDTSPIYVGGVEYNLGKWIKSRNLDKSIYTISKGGFPFDLFNSKKLASGTHSKELLDSLIKNNIFDKNILLSEDGTRILKDTPPGTYSSRLYGNKEQITDRISEELGHILNNLYSPTVLLMHRDDFDSINFKEIKRSQTPVKTILEALGDEKVKNKYWIMGVSNWKTERINEALKIANKYNNLPKPVLNSPYFSLFEMSEQTIHARGIQVTHKDMMNSTFQKGIKIMPYSPLGGFSILDKPEPRWENAKKDAKHKYDKGDPYWKNVYSAIFTQKNESRYYRVVDFTKKFNKKHKTNYTIDQMINAYALAHTRTDFLTIGPINIEQLRRSISSIKLSHSLTSNDLEYLYDGKLTALQKE